MSDTPDTKGEALLPEHVALLESIANNTRTLADVRHAIRAALAALSHPPQPAMGEVERVTVAQALARHPDSSWDDYEWEDMASFVRERFLEQADLAIAALSQPPAVATPAIHPETEKLVATFAEALRTKLAKAEAKYGYTDNWLTDDWEQDCQIELARHVQKGDPLDVAAYAAFCWARGYSTAPAVATPAADAEVRKAMQLVPQSWIDRAMLIETAADGLVSAVNDATHRAQEGSGRLYAANIAVMDDRVTAVLEAINLPEAPFGKGVISPKVPAVAIGAGEVTCPSSPDGRHQVDTSMESGPNNCFYCEASMGGR